MTLVAWLCVIQYFIRVINMNKFSAYHELLGQGSLLHRVLKKF